MKNIFLGMLILLGIQVTFRELTDKRPVIFENYNEEEFRTEMTKRYLGKNVDVAIEQLIASKIYKMTTTVIVNYIAQGMQPDGVYFIGFEYLSPIISMHPYRDYSIGFEINKDRNIIGVAAGSAGWLDGRRW